MNTDFVAGVEAGEGEGLAGAACTIDDVPCMYWMASASGKWARAESLTTMLQYKDQIYMWMGYLNELDDQFFYTASSRYLGAYWAALPSFAGQDLDKAEQFFQTAIEANPDHFGNRVLYADYWAKKTQNRAVFTEQLTFVVNGDASVIPGLEPEQIAEQAKAQFLLDNVDEYFAE